MLCIIFCNFDLKITTKHILKIVATILIPVTHISWFNFTNLIIVQHGTVMFKRFIIFFSIFIAVIVRLIRIGIVTFEGFVTIFSNFVDIIILNIIFSIFILVIMGLIRSGTANFVQFIALFSTVIVVHIMLIMFSAWF